MLKYYRYSKSQSWLVSGTGLLAQRCCLLLCGEEEREPPAKSQVYIHITAIAFKPLYILEYQQSQKLLRPLVLFKNTSLPALFMVLSHVFSPLRSPMEQAFASKWRLKCCC